MNPTWTQQRLAWHVMAIGGLGGWAAVMPTRMSHWHRQRRRTNKGELMSCSPSLVVGRGSRREKASTCRVAVSTTAEEGAKVTQAVETGQTGQTGHAGHACPPTRTRCHAYVPRSGTVPYHLVFMVLSGPVARWLVVRPDGPNSPEVRIMVPAASRVMCGKNLGDGRSASRLYIQHTKTCCLCMLWRALVRHIGSTGGIP